MDSYFILLVYCILVYGYWVEGRVGPYIMMPKYDYMIGSRGPSIYLPYMRPSHKPPDKSLCYGLLWLIVGL